jgi:D-serine deaminase-like pyridoxal phosphate-dependent protein
LTPDAIETPAGLVDLGRVEKNLDRVATYCRRHGIAWRPHVKTHKSRRIARLQIEAGAAGLTVATPFEAEVMSAVTDDLLLAYPPVGPARLDRLMSLPDSVRLGVSLDSVAVVEPLARAARAAGRNVRILVELDVGARRVGVATPEAAVDVARAADGLDGVWYDGVAFYPGHIRVPQAEQGPLLQALSTRLAEFTDALTAAGLPPQTVSGGSTPTLFRSHEVLGMTEIRPGTCVFNDRDIADMGVVSWDELAYTVLATVVSVEVPGRVAVDAGSKALSKEAFRGRDGGFGVLYDRPDVPVASLSEEHGVLDVTGTDWRPRVGDQVRIVPNHVCVSVNLQDRYVVRRDDEIVAWSIDAQGRGLSPD